MEGLSNYEQWKVAYQSSKKPSGTSIVALALSGVAVAVGVGAGVIGCSKAKAAERYSEAKYDGLREMIYMQSKNIDGQTNLIAAERAERIEGDRTLSITINDTVSGSQQGTQNASLSSIQNVEQNLLNQAIMGNLREAPQRVTLWRDAQACDCPNQCGR